MGTRERRERSDATDKALSHAFSRLTQAHSGFEGAIALAGVGGYGRGELSPGSDLDLLILHDGSRDGEELAEFVNAFLYPLWSGDRLIDHAVRTRLQTREVSQSDVKVGMGLLDIRYVAGNAELVEQVASDAADEWRRNFNKNFPEIKKLVRERAERSGELAFLLEPDLKESRGGLRDITTIRSIAYVGLVPVALERLAAAESLLANVRESLHTITGRHRDRLLLTEQDKVAAQMNFVDADALMLEIAKAARTVDYVMDLTFHRIEHSKKKSFFKRSSQIPIAHGLVIENEEVTLDKAYSGEIESGFGLNAAAIAAQSGYPLSIDLCIHLAQTSQALPVPWPRHTRENLISLLGAGDATVRVWEALDQEGFIESWIPEWRHVRFLPQRNVLHHHTVDRHMLETAVRAAKLIRQVHRPDLLLFAAAFHDIGKGFADLDHSEYGEILISRLASRVGFPEDDCQTLALLVRHHLLLSAVATRRDLDDPATIAYVVDLVKNPQNLELLHALSIADGEATGRTAWSDWKAGLVSDLVSRSLAAMSGFAPAAQLELSTKQEELCAQKTLWVAISSQENTYEIEIIAPDQVGLLSVVAGVLSISRMDVRSAKTRSYSESAVMKWIVALDVNAPVPSADKLRELLIKALAGEINLVDRIDERIRNYRKFPGIPVAPPVVKATNDFATNATVLDVRMHDRPGVLYTVAKAVTRFGVDIRGAIVATLGAEAFDTLYLTDLSGNALDEGRAVLLANQVEQLLLTQ